MTPLPDQQIEAEVHERQKAKAVSHGGTEEPLHPQEAIDPWTPRSAWAAHPLLWLEATAGDAETGLW
eukprot:CAMPEP_0206233832 /NCGR_PEP_ID=MMETSP0047_2-20121206/12233_1 /ASSEMBLY_ACC=CAM_ASM_000192 /TAXON_ID=195065 /ORGANISM="Chroomonas mesostigmatica_cf, Strain CCMP1168" /LENGTH=66 /DNA_ID=CAMNT_0053657809 /DNA_START=654 /DNA_END=852 /DNA_ORIENTATION=-